MEVLKEANFQVEWAHDGVECVSMLTKAEPGYYDAILMDIQMPNLNGYLAAKKIRGLADPQKAGIAIVAMTANAFEEDRREAFNAGMNGFVPKPIEMDKLYQALAEVLK